MRIGHSFGRRGALRRDVAGGLKSQSRAHRGTHSDCKDFEDTCMQSSNTWSASAALRKFHSKRDRWTLLVGQLESKKRAAWLRGPDPPPHEPTLTSQEIDATWPTLDLAGIFRISGPAYRARHDLPLSRLRVMRRGRLVRNRSSPDCTRVWPSVASRKPCSVGKVEGSEHRSGLAATTDRTGQGENNPRNFHP